jgi:hypothetical protein
VALENSASLDVSSPKGGGTILVGGDAGGKPLFVPNAKTVRVEDGAEIFADGFIDGGEGRFLGR